MHILERYSLSCGAKIGKPFLIDHFYPIPFEKYITVHTTGKFESRKYDYWPDVIDLIKNHLHNLGYKIVQVGTKEDPAIPNVDLDVRGQINVKQTAYIIKNSSLHVGMDSLPVHIASMYDIPIVALYPNMYSGQSKPYWNKKNKPVLIESHRNGLKPSYSANESPKTVNMIFPEKIAKSVLDHFGGKDNITQETLFIGPLYHHFSIELVPDFVISRDQFNDGICNLRMDLHHDDENFARIASSRKVNVIINRPINLRYIEICKHNIFSINVELNESFNVDYIDALKRLGIQVFLGIYEDDEEKLNQIRYDYFEYEVEKLERNNKRDLDFLDKINENTMYKTNKFILSKKGIYTSKISWKNNTPVSSFQENVTPISLNEEFWEEKDYFQIFNK